MSALSIFRSIAKSKFIKHDSTGEYSLLLARLFASSSLFWFSRNGSSLLLNFLNGRFLSLRL